MPCHHNLLDALEKPPQPVQPSAPGGFVEARGMWAEDCWGCWRVCWCFVWGACWWMAWWVTCEGACEGGMLYS